MPSEKAEKIDLNVDYPCPCRRRGRLSNIILTEALGCNKCQQIFVVLEGGYVIEQLSTNYRQKKTWCWTGREWRKVYSGWVQNYWSVWLSLLLVVCLLLACLFYSADMLLWMMVVTLLVVLLWVLCNG